MQGLIQLCRKIQNILYCTVLGWAVLGCDLRAGGLPQTICKGESAIVGTDIGADCDLSMGVTWEYKDETMEDYLIFSTTAEAQTVSPTLSTTYRLTKFCDSGGVITSCQETYIVNVVSIAVHPIDTDFATDKEGVIIISTLMPDDHEFYTVTNTAMDGSAAQINAGEVRITAHITPVSLAHNVEVTFKLIDPIDLSPYTFELEDGNEPILFFPKCRDENHELAVNDNKYPGTADDYGLTTCTANTGTAIYTYNGVQVCMAETMLKTAIDTYSGDNFIIEATITIDGHECSSTTLPLVCWKRKYLQQKNMISSGTVLWNPVASSACLSGCTINVQDASSFSTGDEIILFNNSGNESTAIIESIQDNGLSYDVPDQITLSSSNNLSFEIFSGVMKVSDYNSPSFFDLQTTHLLQAFGSLPNGDDNGSFVEFKVVSQENIPNCIIKDADLFPDFLNNYFNAWYDIEAGDVTSLMLSSGNQMMSYLGLDYFGQTNIDLKKAIVFNKTISDYSTNNNMIAINFTAETTAHEMGHMLGLTVNQGPAHIHLNSLDCYGVTISGVEVDSGCLMTSCRVRDDNVSEFEKNCHSIIRSNAQ